MAMIYQIPPSANWDTPRRLWRWRLAFFACAVITVGFFARWIFVSQATPQATSWNVLSDSIQLNSAYSIYFSGGQHIIRGRGVQGFVVPPSTLGLNVEIGSYATQGDLIVGEIVPDVVARRTSAITAPLNYFIIRYVGEPRVFNNRVDWAEVLKSERFDLTLHPLQW